MWRSKIALTLLGGTAALTLSTAMAGDAGGKGADRSEMLAVTCAGCHGTDGKSPGPIPALHGLPADYIADAMKAFRDGKRPATVMNRIAKGYSDAEIDKMAEAFAKPGEDDDDE